MQRIKFMNECDRSRRVVRFVHRGLTNALLCVLATAPALRGSELPQVARDILAKPDRLDVLSLYPVPPEDAPGDLSEVFYGFPVLGKLAVTDPGIHEEILEAVARGDLENNGSVLGCYSPRHGIHAVSGDTVLDIVVCFECLHGNIYIDGQHAASIYTSPSPQVLLDTVLRNASVPLGPRTDPIPVDDIERRWVAGMPTALQPHWKGWRDHVLGNGGSPDSVATLEALAAAYPNKPDRILALLAWYGSGAGSWVHFPRYERDVRELLLFFSTVEVVEAIQAAPLERRQIEGAARLFADEDFLDLWPDDLKTLPADLKQALLKHCLESNDADKRQRATRAFTDGYTVR